VAIKKLQSIFEKDFKAAQAAYRNKYSLPGTLTVFKLGGVDQLNDMVKGANQVMQQYGVEFNKNINTVEVWSKVSAKLGKEYARKKSIGTVLEHTRLEEPLPLKMEFILEYQWHK
jgi:hypothetical protein